MNRVSMFAALGLALVVAPRLASADPTAALKQTVQEKAKAKIQTQAQQKAKAKAQEKAKAKAHPQD